MNRDGHLPLLIEFMGTKRSIDPADRRLRNWARAFDNWLSARRASVCRKYYQINQRAWRELLNYYGLPPWEITPAKLEAWIEHLKGRLSAGGILNFISAISSFYDYCHKQGVDGGGEYFNPALDAKRPSVKRPSRPKTTLSVAAAQALLAAIDHERTLIGKRDYAFFVLLLTSGEKPSIVAKLRWGFIKVQGERRRIAWPNGRGVRWRELPEPVWLAIQEHLQASRRLACIQAEDYVFATQGDHSLAAQGKPEAWSPEQPLNLNITQRMLKAYAEQAGLPGERITLTSLQRTAILLQEELVANPQALEAFLGLAPAPQRWAYLDKPAEELIAGPDDPQNVVPYRRPPQHIQPGEQRSLKHGFYSSNPLDPQRLEEAGEITSLAHEIARLRILMDWCLEQALEARSFDERLRLMDTYGLSATRVASLIKTQKELEKEDFLPEMRRAIVELGEEMGIVPMEERFK